MLFRSFVSHSGREYHQRQFRFSAPAVRRLFVLPSAPAQPSTFSVRYDSPMFQRIRSSRSSVCSDCCYGSSAGRICRKARFFHEKIAPLLESRCFECHGEGDVEGGLRATSRATLLQGGETGPAIVPGDPDRSLMIQAVRYEALQMPPKDKLPDEEDRKSTRLNSSH